MPFYFQKWISIFQKFQEYSEWICVNSILVSYYLCMSKLRKSKNSVLPVSPSQLVTGVPEPPHDHLLLVLLGGDGQGVPHRHPPVLASCQQSDQSLPLASVWPRMRKRRKSNDPRWLKQCMKQRSLLFYFLFLTYVPQTRQDVLLQRGNVCNLQDNYLLFNFLNFLLYHYFTTLVK